MSLIKIQNLHKNFGDLEVLRDINLDIETGEVIALIGPSGSGKSTLLRCINLLEIPTSGHIYYRDEEITHPKYKEEDLNLYRQKIGMVFQQFNLFPHLSVTENITLSPMLTLGLSKEEATERAHALLDRVGLIDKKDSYPAKLSGGQSQRVAIARALAMQPEVMLFDEPTSALDPEMVKEVLEVIRELAESGMTCLIVTHELAFAKEISSRILFLDDGDILADQPPQDFFTNPASPRAKEFLSLVF